MVCNKCGKDIANDAIFCSYCGQAVKNGQMACGSETKLACLNCNKEFDSQKSFCDVCGVKLVEKTQNTPHLIISDTDLRKSSAVLRNNNESVRHDKLYELTMVSKYNGEPTVGVASATGKLIIYSDTVEFEKSFGNSAAAAFGLVGVLVAQNKVNKDGKTEVYPIRSIQSVTKGKYMGIMPTLVIHFTDGNTISFSGITKTGDIDNAVRIIESCM